MRCISRYTDEKYSQKFGDNYHNFYVEMRCNIKSNTDICSKCFKKTNTKSQHSRTFDHGKIHEAIPDNSHIFGSKWYHDSVKKYGVPSNKVLALAEKYRLGANMEEPVPKPVPVNQVEPIVPKPVNQVEPIPIPVNQVEPIPTPVNQVEPIVPTPTQVEPKPVKPQNPVKSKPKRRPPVANTPELVYKDVTLPTYLETKLEELEGFQIEYIPLKHFEHNGVTYFKDKKNKLYKKINNKIGQYVIMNIPDSDDET